MTTRRGRFAFTRRWTAPRCLASSWSSSSSTRCCTSSSPARTGRAGGFTTRGRSATARTRLPALRGGHRLGAREPARPPASASHTMRRAKIVCTLGPASLKPEMLEELLNAGMDVARLNFSHGSHAQHAQTHRHAARRLAQGAQGSGHPRRPAGPEDPHRQLRRRAAWSWSRAPSSRITTDETVPGTRRDRLHHLPAPRRGRERGRPHPARRRPAGAEGPGDGQEEAGAHRGRPRRHAEEQQGHQPARRGAAGRGADARRTARTCSSASRRAWTTWRCPSCASRRTSTRRAQAMAEAGRQVPIIAKLEKPEAHRPAGRDPRQDATA